jgi:hypothetical protein
MKMLGRELVNLEKARKRREESTEEEGSDRPKVTHTQAMVLRQVKEKKVIAFLLFGELLFSDINNATETRKSNALSYDKVQKLFEDKNND